MDLSALRGRTSARIDDKGRLKVPTSFRTFVEQKFGPKLFVTTINGASVRLYPLPVWEEFEQKLATTTASFPDPDRDSFLDFVNYWGQEAELDKQGRVVIHQDLREAAGITGEVAVFGKFDFLEVWNHERFVTTRLKAPTDDAMRSLAAKYGTK